MFKLSISLAVILVALLSISGISANTTVLDSFQGFETLVDHESDSGHRYRQLTGRTQDAQVRGHLQFTTTNSARYRLYYGGSPVQYRAAEVKAKIRLHGEANTAIVLGAFGRDVRLYVDGGRLFFIDFQGKPVQISDRDMEGIVSIMAMPQGPDRVLIEVRWLGNENFPGTEITLGRASLPAAQHNYIEIGAEGHSAFEALGTISWLEVYEVKRGRPVK